MSLVREANRLVMFEERIWMVVLDDRQGRLLRGQRVRTHDGENWRLRLEEVKSIENAFVELEDSGSAPEDAHGAGSRAAELHARYAVEAVQWLTKEAQVQGIEQLEVFAPGRLAALLRSMYPVALERVVKNHSFDGSAASVKELERHAALLEVVEARASRSSKKAS